MSRISPCVVFICTFCVVSVAENGAGPAAAQPRGTATIADLVELLGRQSPGALEQGEAILAALNKDRTPHVMGTYVVALLQIRERKLDRAVVSITALPDETEKLLPFLRLRLWIELERGKLDVAKRILPVVQAQLLNTDQTEREKNWTMKQLGGFAAIFPAAEKEMNFQAVEAAVRASGKKEDLLLSAEFRDAEKHAGQQRDVIDDVVKAGRADAAGIAEKYKEALDLRRTADADLQITRKDLPLTTKESREATQQLPFLTNRIDRRIGSLQNSNQAPNKPTEPTPPKEPSEPRAPTEPRRSDYADDRQFENAKRNYDRDKQKYDRDKQDYERERRDFKTATDKYNDDRRTFPSRMAAWEKENREWPTTKLRLIAEQKQERDKVVAKEKELRERVVTMRNDVTKLTKLVRESDFCVQVLKRLSTVESLADQKHLLTRPSSYDLLSFAQEHQRLKQLLQAMPNP